MRPVFCDDGTKQIIFAEPRKAPGRKRRERRIMSKKVLGMGVWMDD